MGLKPRKNNKLGKNETQKHYETGFKTQNRSRLGLKPKPNTTKSRIKVKLEIKAYLIHSFDKR